MCIPSGPLWGYVVQLWHQPPNVSVTVLLFSYTLPTGSCSKCSRCDIFHGENVLHYSLHLVQLLLCHPVELKLLHSILGDMTCQHEFFRAKSDSCTSPFNLTSNYLSREGRQDSQSDITCILYHSVTGVCCYA